MTFKKILSLVTLNIMMVCHLQATVQNTPIEVLSLDVISYNDFMAGDAAALTVLERALYEKGIVGIKGIPGYKEKLFKFIETAKSFSALPEEIKEAYAPNHSLGETFLGYERGKEKFKRADGTWVVDDLKISYYGLVPDNKLNKWPTEIDLQTPFEDLGGLMSQMGEAVMQKIGLLAPDTEIFLDGVPRVGRMLYYRKSIDGSLDNPFWCGAHFDHSIFTALLPSFYFINGEAIAEPMEAGLFVKTTSDGIFKKVLACDHDVLMFQVGEFGQLVTNDGIRATEHRVQKANGCIERYTMALFFDAPKDVVIHSFSELTQDSRYGGAPGTPCSYGHWDEETFKRYIVEEKTTQN